MRNGKANPAMRKIPLYKESEKQLYFRFFEIVLIIVIVCGIYTKFNPFEIFMNADYFWSFIFEDFLPPSMPEVASTMLSIGTTLAMAISATTVGGILALFVSLFGSEYISPYKGVAKIVRGFATFMRNIPTLVWAFILFSSLGIGTGVGFIALVITSFAFLVRAFIETMDEVSSDCVESLEAVGASFWQRVFHGIWPSCIHGYLSWFLYSLEVNIRASTIVGMVGGGGIGMVLFSYLKSFKYHRAAGIILAIAVMVILVELLTNTLRKRMESFSVKYFLLGIGLLNIISFFFLDIECGKLISRLPEIPLIFVKLFGFQFHKMDLIFEAILETISVAVLSTFLGVVLGLFFGVLAAENILHIKGLPTFVKSFFSFIRAVPTLVWVLLMLVCLGFGPAAGIVGLCIHTTAFFTRSFAQSFEDVSGEVIEALEATGAGKMQIFFNAILSSSLSQIIAWIGMRFEINFAECAILGMVGAGGIGFMISNSIQSYEYGTAGVAIVLVFVFAYFIERIFVIIKRTLAKND